MQIARDEPPPDACSAFVSIHGLHACSTKEMKKLLKGAAGRYTLLTIVLFLCNGLLFFSVSSISVGVFCYCAKNCICLKFILSALLLCLWLIRRFYGFINSGLKVPNVCGAILLITPTTASQNCEIIMFFEMQNILFTLTRPIDQPN